MRDMTKLISLAMFHVDNLELSLSTLNDIWKKNMAPCSTAAQTITVTLVAGKLHIDNFLCVLWAKEERPCMYWGFIFYVINIRI